MDDIKLFANKEKELETLIHTVRIYSRDIGIDFVIEKCAMLVMKSGKRQLTDGMELRNQDNIKTLAETKPTNKWKWKKKFSKNIPGELENFSTKNSIAEILSKE